MKGRRRSRAGLGVVLLVAILAGCSGGDDLALGGVEPTVPGDTTVTTALDPTLVRTATGAANGPRDPRIGKPIDGRPSGRDLKFGVCVNEMLAPGASGLAERIIWALDCTAPHDAEVYAVFSHPAPSEAPFPGRSELDREVASTCASLFTDFVGLEYPRSALAISFLRPNSETWSANDREIVCSVYDATLKPLAGSVAGIAR